MCGIVGIVERDLEPASAAERPRSGWCGRCNHRGPDEEGSITLPGVGLGMRRLAIVDLAGGQQPIANEDRRRSRSSPTARSTTSASCSSELEARGHRFRSRIGHRGAGPRLRGVGRGVSRAAARHVRAGALGRPHAHADRRARSRRREAALLDQTPQGLLLASEVKALLVRPEVDRASSIRSARSVPDLRIRHRAADDAQGRPQAAAGALSHLPRRRG